MDAGGYCGSWSIQRAVMAKGAWIFPATSPEIIPSRRGGHDEEILATKHRCSLPESQNCSWGFWFQEPPGATGGFLSKVDQEAPGEWPHSCLQLSKQKPSKPSVFVTFRYIDFGSSCPKDLHLCSWVWGPMHKTPWARCGWFHARWHALPSLPWPTVWALFARGACSWNYVRSSPDWWELLRSWWCGSSLHRCVIPSISIFSTAFGTWNSNAILCAEIFIPYTWFQTPRQTPIPTTGRWQACLAPIGCCPIVLDMTMWVPWWRKFLL